MFRWVARQYAKRIVNINVNIVVAGLLAIMLTAIPLHLSRYVGVKDDDKWTILIITFASDWVFDLLIAVGLHWLANHWPQRLKGKQLIQKAEDVIESTPPPIPFIKDATIIQLQRACLSPLLYAIALGLQWLLIYEGMGREVAALIGFTAGILVCRVIHTFWLIRIDRQHLADWERQRAERLADLERKRAISEQERAQELTEQARQATQRAAAHTSAATSLEQQVQRLSSSRIGPAVCESQEASEEGRQSLPHAEHARDGSTHSGSPRPPAADVPAS